MWRCTSSWGDENIFLFGLTADQVEERRRQGYRSLDYYQQDPVLKRVLDQISAGFSDGRAYTDLTNRLLFGGGGGIADEYMLLADFDSYCQAHRRSLRSTRTGEPGIRNLSSTSPSPASSPPTAPSGTTPGTSGMSPPGSTDPFKAAADGSAAAFSVRLSAGWNAVPLPEMVGRDFQENHLQNVNKCNKIEGEAD